MEIQRVNVDITSLRLASLYISLQAVMKRNVINGTEFA
jgi:hypothetical protein